jgi:hypothetical protein
LSTPLILRIDAINNLGITYLSRTKSFIFREELDPENFQKADLSYQCPKISASTGIPVRLEQQKGKIKDQFIVEYRPR